MKPRSRKNRGSILMITMIIILLAAIVATGLAGLAVFEFADVSRYEIYKNEFEVAEAVLAKAFAEICFLVEYTAPNLATEIANIQPPVCKGYVVKNFAINKMSEGYETITNPGSPWNGMYLYVAHYRVTARVHQDSNTASRFKHPGVQLSQDLDLQYIPLYLFAIFYTPNLEIHPGMPMVVNGRVHCNATMYCASGGSSLKIQDYVTAVGNIIHGASSPSGMVPGKGNDSFTNGSSDVSMWDGSKWIDHSYGNWATVATSRWENHVFDSAHEVEVLKPAIPRLADSAGNPDAHALIERANPSSPDEAPGTSLRQEKFEYKAGLKIVMNPSTGIVEGYDQAGNPVSLTYPDPADPANTKSIVFQSTFDDVREGKTVSSLDVNIANLIESGKAPENGILYLSNEGEAGVVRVTNASKLPASISNGFSIATDDPLYLKGDFNTVEKKCALIAADTVAVQSNSWNDANSSSGNFSKRIAGETTVNGVVFQGLVPSQEVGGTKHYSGGVENFFRFMENWSGVNFRFNGSLICIWESTKARGFWGRSFVYSPPIRTWAWDSMYVGSSGPPGCTRVFRVVRRNWNVRSL